MCSWDETILVFLMSGGSTISLINNIVLNLSYIQPPPYGFFFIRKHQIYYETIMYYGYKIRIILISETLRYMNT